MEADHLHHSNCQTKLNFHTPLLSTRRPWSPTRRDSILPLSASHVSSDRTILYSWEQAPVTTKDAPPRFSPRLSLHQSSVDWGGDEGFDGDDDENDVYSLSEAMDIVQRAERAHKLDGDLKQKLEEGARETPSPSFMMERFLPDATALAASSAFKFSSHESHGFPVWSAATYSEKAPRATEPCSSPKGCGLQTLLPNWRIKQRLRGVKGPVRQGFVSARNHCRPKQKKHYQN